MKDAKKYLKRLGVKGCSIMRQNTPAGVVQDTCPLCGHYMPLDKRGYCGTEECSEAAAQTARGIAREQGKDIVEGLYYKLGDVEIVNFEALEKWKPPVQQKHPDMCNEGECTDWAIHGDYLCRHHRQSENREAYRTRNRTKRILTKKRTRKAPKLPGNKIKGLGKIKIG